jgi:membrane protein required for colicin V production
MYIEWACSGRKAVTITFFDILILFALLGGALVGFYRGFLRQATSTLLLYISIVISTIFYRSVSRTLVRLTGQLPHTTDVLGFFLVMAVVLVVLFLVRRELMSNVDADRRPIWHNIVGMVFGFLNAAIICAITIIVLRSIANGASWPAYQGFQNFLRKQTATSWMVYVFTPFTRLLLTLIEPWLFGNRLPPLLRNAL